MDKFHEQLLRTQKSSKYNMCTVIMYLLMVLSIMNILGGLVLVNISLLILGVIFLALFFVLRFFRDKQYKEFEYTFTNGNLQIDVIYNKKKRKKLYDVEVKNFDEFGKSSDIKINEGVKKVTCIPWDNKNEKYVFQISENGKQAVYIAPDEDLLKLMSVYNVRRSRV